MKPAHWLGFLVVAGGLLIAWDLESTAVLWVIVLLGVILALGSGIDIGKLIAKFPGGSVELERAKEEANKLTEKRLESTAATETVRAKGVKGPARRGDVWTRDDLERLMAISAEWGWGLAKIGFEVPPNPVVHWTEDGLAHIAEVVGNQDSEMLGIVQRSGVR